MLSQLKASISLINLHQIPTSDVKQHCVPHWTLLQYQSTYLSLIKVWFFFPPFLLSTEIFLSHESNFPWSKAKTRREREFEHIGKQISTSWSSFRNEMTCLMIFHMYTLHAHMVISRHSRITSCVMSGLQFWMNIESDNWEITNFIFNHRHDEYDVAVDCLWWWEIRLKRLDSCRDEKRSKIWFWNVEWKIF